MPCDGATIGAPSGSTIGAPDAPLVADGAGATIGAPNLYHWRTRCAIKLEKLALLWISALARFLVDGVGSTARGRGPATWSLGRLDAGRWSVTIHPAKSEASLASSQPRDVTHVTPLTQGSQL